MTPGLNDLHFFDCSKKVVIAANVGIKRLSSGRYSHNEGDTRRQKKRARVWPGLVAFVRIGER